MREFLSTGSSIPGTSSNASISRRSRTEVGGSIVFDDLKPYNDDDDDGDGDFFRLKGRIRLKYFTLVITMGKSNKLDPFY